MDVLEVIRAGEIHLVWLVFILQGIGISVLCCLLAKSKKRNYKLAILLGVVPVINYLSFFYYVGVPKLEKKQMTNS